jgi:hypothetical protein
VKISQNLSVFQRILIRIPKIHLKIRLVTLRFTDRLELPSFTAAKQKDFTHPPMAGSARTSSTTTAMVCPTVLIQIVLVVFVQRILVLGVWLQTSVISTWPSVFRLRLHLHG